MALVTPDDVARGWRTLTDDQKADAQLMIDAAVAWITAPSRRPDLVGNDGDPIAKRVVIEAVRTALGPGAQFTGHTSYAKTIGPWQVSGTLATAAGALGFTAAQLDLLGITEGPTPVGEFGDPPCYRYPPPWPVLP